MKYQNAQLYSECQLVAMWNAARFWSMNVSLPKMGTRRYRKICKDALALHGAAINPLDEEHRVGLARNYGPHERLGWVRKHLPVHVSVFCHRGYHSVLIVGVEGNDVLLANYAKRRLHRMTWKRLKGMLREADGFFQYLPSR